MELKAAKAFDHVSVATLQLGRAVDLKLAATPDVRYAVSPAKPPYKLSSGGMVAFVADKEGIYRILLGSSAWIDVVRGGKAVESTAHGHDLQCAGVRKSVQFKLQPGPYVIQLSDSSRPSLAMMVARAP